MFTILAIICLIIFVILVRSRKNQIKKSEQNISHVDNHIINNPAKEIVKDSSAEITLKEGLLSGNTSISVMPEQKDLYKNSTIETSIRDVYILSYFNNRAVDTVVSDYKLSEFGQDYKQTLGKLLLNGYFRKSDAKEEIKFLTIPYLKDILRTKKLKVSGRKDVLLERIYSNFTTSELEKYSPNKYFMLTDLGEKLLDRNAIYLTNKVSFDFPIAVIARYKEKAEKENMNISDDEILYQICNKKIEKCYEENNFYDLWGLLSRKGDFLSRLGHSKEALKTFVELIALDISGSRNLQKGSCLYIPEVKLYVIAPYQIAEIEKNAIAANILYTNFDAFLVAVLDEFIPKLPFSYYKSETVAEIIKGMLNNTNLDSIKPDHTVSKGAIRKLENIFHTKYIHFSEFI